MTALDPSRCLSVPGRLVLGPTTLVSALPGAPSLVTNLGTHATPGVHQVAVSYKFPSGESLLGAAGSITVPADGINQAIRATGTLNLPPGATGAYVYFTKAGGSTFYAFGSTAGAGYNTFFNATDATLGASPVFPNTGTILALPPTPYPYGGTPLGLVARAKLVREQVYYPAHSEARGRDAVSASGGRFRASLALVLMQHDPDVLNLAWASNTSGAFAGADVLSLPQPGLNGGARLRPGALVPSAPLLLVADDPANPSTLVFAPLWTLGPKLELDKALHKPYETGLVVLCGLDQNNKDVREDLLQNLTLT